MNILFLKYRFLFYFFKYVLKNQTLRTWYTYAIPAPTLYIYAHDMHYAFLHSILLTSITISK